MHNTRACSAAAKGGIGDEGTMSSSPILLILFAYNLLRHAAQQRRTEGITNKNANDQPTEAEMKDQVGASTRLTGSRRRRYCPTLLSGAPSSRTKGQPARQKR